MKTNQNLTRRMGDFEVLQRTKDGMFNATSLMKQWNETSGQNKKLDHYFDNNSTKEFIKALMAEDNLHTQNSVYVKSRASRGVNAGTWMTPLLFIDFAMWLNPTFKVKVLKFVYDELIRYRNEAGDAYREMSSAIRKIVPKNDMAYRMKEVAKALNYIVYGIHESGIRNTQAEEEKARQLCELERDVAKLINKGFVKNYTALMSYLRDEWKVKHTPKVLA
jgi:hypothetical protein